LKIKDAVYDNCTECGRIKGTIVEESFGCDGCKKPIDEQLNNRHRHYLQLTVFREEADTSAEHLQFCSWKCVLKTLPKIKCNYFINLPYLSFDNKLDKGIRAQDFFTAVKNAKKRR
jgi:hypothetical protein